MLLCCVAEVFENGERQLCVKRGRNLQFDLDRAERALSCVELRCAEEVLNELSSYLREYLEVVKVRRGLASSRRKMNHKETLEKARLRN